MTGKRLPRVTEQRLLDILRKSGRKFDEQQACFDFAGILARLPQVIAGEAHRSGTGPRRTPIRILAEIAAEPYFAHSARGPGNSVSEYSGRYGGLYPKFVAILAEAAQLKFDGAKLPDICKEVRRSLNRKAGLPKLKGLRKGLEYHRQHHEYGRGEIRGNLLRTHSTGEDDEGEPTIGGYEPAPDPELDPVEIFKDYTPRG